MEFLLKKKMDNLLNSEDLESYFLINLKEKPCYAIEKSVKLTEHEASVKNYALRLNKSDKKYIKVIDWK